MYKIKNKNLDSRVKTWLNVMLQQDIKGKDELVLHLESLSIKQIEEYPDCILVFFKNTKDTKPLSKDNFPTNPILNMMVTSVVLEKEHYTSFTLIAYGDYVGSLHIYNLMCENYLELENFENIEFGIG